MRTTRTSVPASTPPDRARGWAGEGARQGIARHAGGAPTRVNVADHNQECKASRYGTGEDVKGLVHYLINGQSHPTRPLEFGIAACRSRLIPSRAPPREQPRLLQGGGYPGRGSFIFLLYIYSRDPIAGCSSRFARSWSEKCNVGQNLYGKKVRYAQHHTNTNRKTAISADLAKFSSACFAPVICLPGNLY